ncbi:MAG TPA: very short patch repair endonuclease [Methylomirabilota bacterium]|nr:very short patch repair endonuclease [Methylomirabilota bacterium]
MDRLTKQSRSALMASVRSSGNKSTELRLANAFRRSGIKGWRRKHNIFGRPDFAFPVNKIAVFVDGCFWHRCPKHGRVPKSRRVFWMSKLSRNVSRDRLVSRTLRRDGWCVVRVWECQLKSGVLPRTLAKIRRKVERCGVAAFRKSGKLEAKAQYESPQKATKRGLRSLPGPLTYTTSHRSN